MFRVLTEHMHLTNAQRDDLWKNVNTRDLLSGQLQLEDILKDNQQINVCFTGLNDWRTGRLFSHLIESPVPINSMQRRRKLNSIIRVRNINFKSTWVLNGRFNLIRF